MAHGHTDTKTNAGNNTRRPKINSGIHQPIYEKIFLTFSAKKTRFLETSLSYDTVNKFSLKIVQLFVNDTVHLSQVFTHCFNFILSGHLKVDELSSLLVLARSYGRDIFHQILSAKSNHVGFSEIYIYSKSLTIIEITMKYVFHINVAGAPSVRREMWNPLNIVLYI